MCCWLYVEERERCYSFFYSPFMIIGARWLRGQCARRAIPEAKQRFQWSVIWWVTNIYYLELLRASEGTLSRWSWLHLQLLPPIPVSRGMDVRQAAGCKNNCRIFITTWWIPTPLSGIRVRKKSHIMCGRKGTILFFVLFTFMIIFVYRLISHQTL
jgi:hypothetical protein